MFALRSSSARYNSTDGDGRQYSARWLTSKQGQVEQAGVKINHRIALRHDDPFWREIDRLGLDYDRGDNELVQALKMDGPAVSAAFRF